MEENTHTCQDCGNTFTQEELTEIIERGETRVVCNDCRDHYVTCADRGEQVHESEYCYSEIRDDYYCESCCDDRFTTCYDCGCEIERDNALIGEDDDHYYCDNCYHEHYASCTNCGDYHLIDNMIQDDYEFYCENCRDREEFTSNVIHGYHDRDIPIRYKYLESELIDNKTINDLLYFGTETEVENKKGLITNEEMARKLRTEFRDLEFVFERDGSLYNGFEIISQPMTMAYIKEHKNDLERMFKMLSKNGFASHDTSSCGLHIHFSRNYFADNEDKYLQKLTLFFETYKSELQVFSRRTSFSWCQFVSDNSSLNKRYLKSSVVLKDYVKDNPSHNIAINTGNTNTIEIRIFKGTLKFETYMASLELVNNIVMSVKEKKTRKINFDNTINSYETDYVKTYCAEKNIYNSAYLNDETKNVFNELESKKAIHNKSVDLCKTEYENLLNTIIDLQKDIMNKINGVNDLEGRINLLTNIYQLIKNKSVILRNDNQDFKIDNEDIQTSYKKYLTNNSNDRALRYYEDLVNSLYYVLPNSSNEMYEPLRTIYDNAKDNLQDIRNELNNNMIGGEQ